MSCENPRSSRCDKSGPNLWRGACSGKQDFFTAFSRLWFTFNSEDLYLALERLRRSISSCAASIGLGRILTMRALSRLPASDKEVAFLLFLGYVSCCMFGVSLGVALPQVMVEFSINETQAGWLYSASLWSTAVLLVPSGYLADRFGQKRLLLWGYLLAIIGVTGLAFSQGYLGCLSALLTAGAGLGLVVPPYYAMVGEVLKRVRGLAIGFAASGYYLGGAVGSILVGYFVSLQQWRFAYYIIAAVMFVMMAVQFVRPGPHGRRVKGIPSSAHRSQRY